jgi:MerR family transcriptional regulator, light-induced transcriptional regulator
MSTTPRYPIAAVARLTGLHLDTIRAWERRHGAVSPERGPKGRVYTEAQVRRLRLLAALVGQGHTIGQVAKLPVAALEELLDRTAGRPEGDAAPRAPLGDVIAPVVAAVERFDPASVDREIARLSALYAPRDFVYEVVVPLMRVVGERWHDGQLSVAQEHMVSAVMHGVMSTLVRLHTAPPGASRLVFACPPGEVHEFGLLAAAMLTAVAGLGVVYLGPNLPVEDIAAAAATTGAIAVVLAVTGGARAVVDRLPAVRAALAPHVELWIGGRAPVSVQQAIGGRRRVVPIAGFEEFEQHLKRVGGR